MIGLIAKALQNFNEKGYTVIESDPANGWYAQEVAEYVLDVLKGLKCSVETKYHGDVDTYFITDMMN